MLKTIIQPLSPSLAEVQAISQKQAEIRQLAEESAVSDLHLTGRAGADDPNNILSQVIGNDQQNIGTAG